MAKHEMTSPAAAPKKETAAVKHAKAPKPKNPKARKAVALTLAGLILLGAVGGGGYHYLQNRAGKAVNVYPLQQLGSSDGWYDRVNTGGQVRADRVQAVYLSSTQTVTEVFVQEGQHVMEGDPILAFDTTLDEVELTRKQIAIDQLNLDIQEAQKTLREIDTYKIGSPGGGYSAPERTPAPTAAPEPTEVPWFQGGQGTAEDPYVFLWDEDASLIDGTVDYLLDIAHGYDVPEVTTGPDVPLDPDATPTPTPGDGEGAGLALTAASAGDPVPVGARVPTRLLSPGRAVALRDPAPVSERFAALTGDEILAQFQRLAEDREALAAFCGQFTEDDWAVVADALEPEQLEALRTLLTDGGLEDPFPTAPPEAESTDTPAPESTDPSEPSSTEPSAPTGTPYSIPIAEPQPVDQGPASAGEEPDEPDTEETTPTPSPTPSPLPVGVTYYMVFEIRTNDSMQGDIQRVFELEFTLQELEWQRYWAYRVLDPMYEPQMNMPVDFDYDGGGYAYFDSSEYYTAAEIARMRAETQRDINAKTIQLKMAQQDLKQVEYELSNGQVLATTTGTVRSVLDPDEALQNDEPVVKISGGGGYFITPLMSEFDMQYMHVGDTVTVENYMAGQTLEGVIKEISPYPTDERYPDYYSSGTNGNVSKYPFTVAVSEDADLRDGYYVNVYFSAGGESQQPDSGNAFYLDNAFLRSEGGKNYVYAAGPDGLLEKRFVITGKRRGGYMTEITDGLDPETDYVAFPYGRSVKSGAATVRQEDVSVLYDGY